MGSNNNIPYNIITRQPLITKISPNIYTPWERNIIGIDNTDLSFDKVYEQPLLPKNSSNYHTTWKENSVGFYDSLMNIILSLGYILSLVCMKLECISKRLLQMIKNRNNNTFMNYSNGCIMKGDQKSSLITRDNQDIIYDFCDNLMGCKEHILKFKLSYFDTFKEMACMIERDTLDIYTYSHFE